MKNRIGFGKRLGACLIDGAVISIGGIILGAAMGGMFGGLMGGVAGSGGAATAGAALGGALGAVLGAFIGVQLFALLYNLAEAFSPASPGKRLLGIRIENDDGTAASQSTLFLRYAIKNIAFLSSALALATGVYVLAAIGNFLGFFVALGCFMILGAAKQGLHDKIAKTAVYPTEASAGKTIEEAQGGMAPPSAGLTKEEGVPMRTLVLGGGLALAVAFYFFNSPVKQETPAPHAVTKTPDKAMPAAKKETIPEEQAAKNPPSVEGELWFAGEPFFKASRVEPHFWFRNEDTGKAVSAEVFYDKGSFKIHGLPPGNYGVGVDADANPDNPSKYPGDFDAWRQFSISRAETTRLRIDLSKLIHLRKPEDNGGALPNWGKTCGETSLKTPLKFEWDPIEDGADYDYKIIKAVCAPFSYGDAVASGTTRDNFFSADLPPSGDNDIYILTLTARKDGRVIGSLMVHGGNGYGWDYRFRAAGAGGPVSPAAKAPAVVNEPKTGQAKSNPWNELGEYLLQESMNYLIAGKTDGGKKMPETKEVSEVNIGGAESGDNVPETSPECRAFAEKYVAAVNADDKNLLKGLMHPKHLACVKPEYADIYEELFYNKDLKHQVPANYSARCEKRTKPMFEGGMFSGMFKYPTNPSWEVTISYGDAHKSTDIIREIGEEKGQWLLTPPCLTEKGIEEMRRGAPKRP